MRLRLHVVADPVGWLCVGLVLAVWLYNTLLVPSLVLLPHYREGHVPGAAVAGYYAAAALCLAALIRASTADPGRLPPDPHIPQSERQDWELCNKCNLMRPKRSHHCSRCGHCVRRMDHHCPWINNCVGEDNHWLFLQLCVYTLLLSFLTLLLDFGQYYYLQPLSARPQDGFASRHELALLRVSALSGLLMFGGMSGLFYTQMAGILSDTTTIEKMAQFSSQMFGSRRSWQSALAEVCGTRWKLLWLLPLRCRQPLQAGRYSRAHV